MNRRIWIRIGSHFPANRTSLDRPRMALSPSTLHLLHLRISPEQNILSKHLLKLQVNPPPPAPTPLPPPPAPSPTCPFPHINLHFEKSSRVAINEQDVTARPPTRPRGGSHTRPTNWVSKTSVQTIDSHLRATMVATLPPAARAPSRASRMPLVGWLG